MTAREEWLTARRGGVGGSDAAAVLGHSPWSSPYKVWAEKRGLLPLDEEENERLEAGRRLEPVIIDWYRDVTKRMVQQTPEMIRSDTHPFMLATVDALVSLPGGTGSDGMPGPAGGLECKNVDSWYYRDWAEGAPLHYQIQAQHYMAVTGRGWWSFAVLFGGNRFRWYDFERNDAFIAEMIRKEEAFWELVTSGTAPTVDASDATRSALGQQFSKTDGAAIELPMPESEDLLSRWLQDQKDEAALQDAISLQENQIRRLMGHAESGVVPGRGTFTLKARKGATRRTLRWKDGTP